MSMNTLITLVVKFYSAVLCEGLGLGLEFFKKVLTTTLVHRQPAMSLRQFTLHTQSLIWTVRPRPSADCYISWFDIQYSYLLSYLFTYLPFRSVYSSVAVLCLSFTRLLGKLGHTLCPPKYVTTFSTITLTISVRLQ